ncbi:MAG: cob(I)yrinic acid a,c-diamide adenosyltransferase [Rikenellaceae bacterium]|uniref:cob(I)yrinic acid a,c-diamide adenosyltransferase n=1 Tax=Alistipes sp. TaxID=1872444 RepID=UPI0040559FA7|nr:cob(I)yrinic acid a,c-diamide adenosyltransferase [Rikenellaceae bacterium]
MKLYTKGGDKGRTSLIGGERVRKTDVRVEAYGTADELQANIAYLADKMSHEESLTTYVEDCRWICSKLMTVCSSLAIGSNCEYEIPKISDDDIAHLEGRIDILQSELKPVEYFTIPGGCELASLCHICRTVCRRAERRAIEAAENYEIDHSVLVLLNRLSDYLYALCRTITERLDAEEVLWRP